MANPIKPLEPPDSMHLSAAEGWLGLGDTRSAHEELAQIEPGLRAHPDVLMVRWQICAKLRQWEACVEFAAAVVELAPENCLGWIHRAFALHELKRTQEALATLLPAVGLFPNQIVIRFNLACYECGLGKLPAAKRRLAEVFALAAKQNCLEEWRLAASNDPDLKPLWQGMGNEGVEVG
jgi:predicted Zn-dependent protease